MKNHKIFTLSGYFVLMLLSAFSLVTNILSVVNGSFEQGSLWEKRDLIIFCVVFSIIFLLSLFFFVVWLIRVIKDISINKENK
ncbi:MAG: hypothetical protein PHC62_04700 [Candidatus Izemoplasmatales bacterium]|nr:hypothetical protein [Candidatus Izemoplasmatales bacterium]